MIVAFLSGMIAMGFLVAALLFFRYWRKTADTLFVAFGAAFCLFALNEGLELLPGSYGGTSALTFLPRLLGFCLLVVAILAKNR
jgi:hypothetical protein